jgi:ubiquinone/menaquinone biosynthesis C-methylase UbiE
METNSKTHVCPVERAGGLDHFLRKLIQSPEKILKPYMKRDMTIMDLGCGPGFFTIAAARMLNGTGKVIAVDLQKGMLDKLQAKISKINNFDNIVLHHCKANHIGVNDKADFILAFYVIHEIPDHKMLFEELSTIMKPHAKMLIVEPKFHVKRKEFEDMISLAENTGFLPHSCKQPLFSRAVVLTRHL